MPRVLTLTGFFLVLAASVLAQDKPAQDKPTLEQCHSDSAKWWDVVVKNPKTDKVSFTELQHRVEQLQACAIQDTSDKARDMPYLNLLAHYEHEQIERLNRFMLRNKLWAQFETEDAKGQP